MTKHSRVACFMLSVWILLGTAACAQMGQFVNYTISAQELESLALQEVAKQRFEVSLLGASARLNVDDLGITLDEDGDGRVHVTTQSSLTTTFMGRQYPVLLRLNIAGAPRYSAADHAIYVTDVTLQQSNIETTFGNLQLNGLSQELYTLLHDWLEKNPVYRFDPEEPRYRLLQQLGLDISVEPGQLRVQSAQRR